VNRTAGAPRIREAGDSALLLEVGESPASSAGEAIDEDINRRAVAVAAAVRRRGIPGVRDVVSTFRSVAVFFDPLSTDVAAVAASLHEADVTRTSAGPQDVEGRARLIEVPVVYGGEFGPDLDEVAAFAKLSTEAVIDRHASRTYRVFMLGFLPGFAYMASVDGTIAAPRRANPRLRVAAGSVGIAGSQTGIYPRDSPGGWQIVGRTPLRLFSPASRPPALFSPGDRVRFVPVASPLAAADFLGREESRITDADASRVGGDSAPETARHITILNPGLLTTIQDAGRWGYQDQGVSVSGAMDLEAHRLANTIVGNPRDAATLGATVVGPELRLEQETTVAVGGAELQPTIDGSAVPLNAAVRCRAGSVLRFGTRRSGARAYVAFDGGIAVGPVLGSRATHLLSGLGGLDGRAARAGDRVPLGERTRTGSDPKVRPHRQHAAAFQERAYNRLRILPGPQADYFTPDALEDLERIRFIVSPQSDRMGYRLTGNAPLPRPANREMVSDATFLGALQVPPSGEPILLMADRQTTGGYPQIGIVISADIALAAQLAPGDWVEFGICTREQAISALIAREGKLLAVR
jgi:KipI family sensor histidine kinase inhibitor